jgi:glycerol uptake facilitator-like aquaporin
MGTAMEQNLRAYLAELFGTFALVFAGAATLCASYLPADSRLNPGPAWVAVALAEGCTLAVVLTAIARTSPGCLNPAVTLTLWVFRRLENARAFGLVAAQLLGAVLAGLAVRGLFADDVLRDARMGTPHLRALLGPDGAVTLGGMVTGGVLEAAFTFLVTVAVFATLVDPRAPRLGGVVVGMAQTAVVAVGFRLTGGAANPALYAGPGVWQLTLPGAEAARPLADHPVYWGGPLVGALLGGLFYGTLILPPQKK